MAAWQIPPGPTADELRARAQVIQTAVDDGLDYPVANQHLVSRTLLKPFGGSVKGKSGTFLVPHHIRHGPSHPLGLRGCAKRLNFLRAGAASAESLWKTEVEDHLGAAVRVARAGGIQGDAQAQGVLKDALALHFVRSARWLRIHDHAVEATVERAPEHVVQRARALIDSEYTARYGRAPIDDEARRRYVTESQALADWSRWDSSGALARASIEFKFQQFRSLFRSLSIEVVGTSGGASFLIGDSPAVTLRYDVSEPWGIRVNVALGDASTVLLPIAPDCLIAVADQSRAGSLNTNQIALANAAQVLAADKYVYYAPGSSLRRFVDKFRP